MLLFCVETPLAVKEQDKRVYSKVDKIIKFYP